MNRLIKMLLSRLVLFAFFQALIAWMLNSWMESEKYWLLIATLTNTVSILLLVTLLQRERINYFSLFRFDKKTWKKDTLMFTGLALISLPLVLVPSLILSKWLWGNTTYYHQVLFQPISLNLIWFLFIAFPITIGLAELVTYFGYIMPRLRKKVPAYAVLLLPVIFLSIQHCTLPLVFEPKFIFFRGTMYLPFALMLGFTIYKRPSLLPYLAILHGLLDTMTVFMLVKNTINR